MRKNQMTLRTVRLLVSNILEKIIRMIYKNNCIYVVLLVISLFDSGLKF